MTLDGAVAEVECCAPAQITVMNESDAERVAGMLKALADPLRLRMLSAIANDPRGESCVCDLAELSDVSQPTVSHHLKVLRSSGLVQSERRGTWVWYRLDAAHSKMVVELLGAATQLVGEK